MDFKMEEKEKLEEILRMIKEIADKSPANLQQIKNMVEFRKEHSMPEVESLNDIFYFICGIMYAKGLSNYWNGRNYPKE